MPQNLQQFDRYVISPSVKTCGFDTFLVRGRQNYDQSTLKNAKPPICFRYNKLTQFGSTTSILPRIMHIQQL